MKEKTIEQRLVKAVKARGGICPKWVSLGFDGVPDRLVFLPGRHFGLVEVKAPGEMPRALQVSRHKLLAKLGFPTYILDGVEQIGGILDEIQSARISEICDQFHKGASHSSDPVRYGDGQELNHTDGHYGSDV